MSDDVFPAEVPEDFGDGPPGRSAAEVGMGIARAGVEFLPAAGQAAAELFDLVLAPSLERRRDEWLRKLGEAVDELRDRLEGFDPRDLSGNEQFVSAVLAASTMAVKTHQGEKLDMLRNAIVNAVLPGAPEEHEQMLFLRYVDELTPLHVRVLAFLVDPAAWFDREGLPRQQFMMGSLSTILQQGVPELANRRDIYDGIVADLDARRLSDAASALHTGMTDSGVWAARITPSGRRFLDFITLPQQTR